jgi:hypothetical protein
MSRILQTIGLVTADVPPHLARLAIEGNDSAGAGSTTTVDEKTDEELDEARQEALERGEGDDLDDEQPRSKRAKDVAAFRELQSTNDKLKHDLDAQKRENQEVKDRLAALETTHTSREETNTRTNTHLAKAKERAREVVADIRKLDKNDPEYSEKVYETMLSKIYTDQAEEAEQTSRRTSSETFQQERTLEEQKAQARTDTIAALEEAGLDEQDFELVQALAISKQVTDPGWFKRTKAEAQIPELVQTVKDRIMKTKRGSQEFKEDKKRHREAMDGVIGEGTRGRKGTDDEGESEGPGSMLADLTRLRKTQRRNTALMLHQAER